MPTKVIMPQLGESVVEGTVSKWLKQVGETVNEFEPLLEVSTDKVDTEVPAPANGTLLQIYVAEGETVERGALLAMIGQPGEAVPDAPATIGESVVETSRADQARQPQIHASANGETQHTQHSQQSQQAQRYSPVVARMAAEHSIDLTQIQGSGMGGRVTKKDVEAYLAGDKEKIREAAPQTEEIPPWEQPVTGDLFKPTSEIFEKARQQAQPAQVTPVSQDQTGTLVPLNAMRRMIAEHMVRSKLQTAPHVTTVFEVDMSRVMAHWNANMEPFARQGTKLTLTAASRKTGTVSGAATATNRSSSATSSRTTPRPSPSSTARTT
jgi:2-oxoglutarate dehydrogenase E2 component (dihydrolipoamide succinyltransferase)